ncbi:MAG: DUF4115 domain-containing protein [Gammaproteobacteria bacterium]|nr:DUF4115 domain-containing protein [Gammaproteobacteria bacterium]
MSATPRDGGPVIDPEDPTGPGAQLREARHRANLSLEEVATQLRLDRRTVRALEENEFQHLPAPTFIRGYIRSYARLLGLPPGPILEAYDYQGFTPPAIMADITQRPQARFSDISVRLATLVVAGGLVAMVVLWWHSRESTPETPSEVALVRDRPGEISSTPTAGAAGETSSPEQTPLEPPAPPAEELIGAAGAPEPAVAAAPEPEPAPAPPMARVDPEPTLIGQAPAPGEPAPPEPASSASTRESAGDGAPTSGSTGTVTVREALITPGETPPSPPGRLVIRFSEESWVEIFDADGIRQEFKLASPGSTTRVAGTPPFNVLLGYAEGAVVTFDGQDYDISRYIRGDTARFLIGPEGLARARPPERRGARSEDTAQAEADSSGSVADRASGPSSPAPEAAASGPSADSQVQGTN